MSTEQSSTSTEIVTAQRTTGSAAAPASQHSFGARYRWPLIITGLLVAHVCAMMTAVKIATGDVDRGGINGNTVDPDYGLDHKRHAEARGGGSK